MKKINPKQVLRSVKENYCDSIHDELTDKGMVIFEPNNSTLNINNDFLVLPANITEVTTKELGEYLNAFTQQKMYIRTLVGYAEVFCEEAKREYLSVSRERYESLSLSKISETAKDRMLQSDKDIKPYYDKYIDCKTKVNLLNYNILSIEEAIFLISREVSRRTADFNEENRVYNLK